MIHESTVAGLKMNTGSGRFQIGLVEKTEWGVGSGEWGVRSAECGVRSAECGVRNAECGVRSAECGVRRAESQLMQTPRFPLSGKVGVWKTRSPKKKYCVILRVFRSVEKSECGKRGVLRKSVASYSVFSTLVENAESRLFLSFSQKIIIE